MGEKNQKKELKQESYATIFKDFANQFPDLNDDELHNKTQTAFEFEKEVAKNYISDMNGKKYFSISNFLSGTTLFNSYNKRTNLYTPEEIETLVQNADKSKTELMVLSRKLYTYIQEYKQIVNRYAALLNYYPVVLPLGDVTTDRFINILKYFEGYNYKTKLQEITQKLVMNDIFYGYELTRNGTTKKVLKEMPLKYCRLTGKDEYGVYLYEFDLTYFDKSKKELDNFPNEFRYYYNKFKDNGGSRWFEPDISKQFAFKFDISVQYALPYFAGVFVDMARLQEIKVAQTLASKIENYKLIHFKAPINEKSGEMDDYLISPDNAEVYHQLAKNNLPSGVGITTNPFDIESVSLKTNNDANSNIVDRHYTSLMSSAGMSRLLTNSNTTGSTGLQASVEVDESIMFRVLRQYEAFFTRQLSYKFGNMLSVDFIDSTVHNKWEVHKTYKEAANTGFNRFYVSSSAGISQLEVIYGRKIEKELELDDLLNPLATAHTQSSEDMAGNEPLSDEGDRTQDKE